MDKKLSENIRTTFYCPKPAGLNRPMLLNNSWIAFSSIAAGISVSSESILTSGKSESCMINIGNSMKGCIARLDNYLNDGIDRLLKVKTDEYENEQTNLDAAIKEINKTDEYAERIKEIKERLQILDLQLGIKKKEGN